MLIQVVQTWKSNGRNEKILLKSLKLFPCPIFAKVKNFLKESRSLTKQPEL